MVMVTSVLRDQQYTLWYKKFAHGLESVIDDKRPGHSVVSTTEATIAAVRWPVLADRGDVIIFIHHTTVAKEEKNNLTYVI